MRMLGKFGLAATVVAAAMLMPAKSEAATITSAGDTFSFSWSFACGAAGTCTGTADFTVDSFTSSSLGLTIEVDNTLDTSFALFLVGLGFDLDPSATSITSFTAGTYLDQARLDVNFPTAGGTLNICTDTGGNGSCGSGSPDGIPSPGTDTISLVLGGAFGDSVELEPLFVKYAGEPGSFEGEGDGGGGDTVTPEPASLLLLGFGALIGGHRARRRFAAR